MGECEQHYENVVNWFINQYKWKAMIIPYKDYIAGYSLYAIGIKMGFETSTSILSDFLENADVQITKNTEFQKYFEIIGLLKRKNEEENRRGI